MTQFSMDPVAKLGLLKMDFLGLTNLTILDRAVKLVKERRGEAVDLNNLPLDDPETFELLSSGNTSDLFQLESAGMQRYIKELKPSNLGDISAMIALYRPGPMEHIDRFINAKFGREEITYPHPSLKDLLDETYGVIVYQDQVLLILQQFAGYTLGEADIVRKAMGKKISSLMVQEREKFVAGAQAKGFDQTLAVAVFDLIEPFAGYAFNKAHSVSYALISYWTSYFKKHYTLEYMASVLNSRLDNPEKVAGTINECFRMGIPVLLPDINRSEELFIIDDHGVQVEDGGAGSSPNSITSSGPSSGLRMGLSAIKSVGEGAVRPLVAERKENGPFDSIDDFCRRANSKGLNRRMLESLVKAGAFDSLASRGALLNALDQVIATAQMEAKARESGQTSMFGGGSASGAPGITLDGPDASNNEKASWERELLGVPLSYNPLKELAALDSTGSISSTGELDEEMKGQAISVVGHLSTVSSRETREHKKFIIATMELVSGSLEVMVWPDVLERTSENWKEGNLLRVAGKLRLRGDEYSLVCEQVESLVVNQTVSLASNETAVGKANGTNGMNSDLDPLVVPVGGTNGSAQNGQNGHPSNGNGNGKQTSPAPPVASPAVNAGSRTVSIGVTETQDPLADAHLLREVVGVLLEYQGTDKIKLQISTGGHRVVMDLPTVSTGYCPLLQERLEELLGHETVTVQEQQPQDIDDAAF
ncbi:MAG: hypothetical protein BZY88_13925 [SAR202 cluster bacterium Io17-Chloro-G9]|nr:MAG: hypothetical protein BZY88_13925 [SAR202 cluster bacterium Io17-Chloro-G9]